MNRYQLVIGAMDECGAETTIRTSCNELEGLVCFLHEKDMMLHLRNSCGFRGDIMFYTLEAWDAFNPLNGKVVANDLDKMLLAAPTMNIQPLFG